MRIENEMQTLREFVEDRERLNDCKDGIKVTHTKDVFILRWN